MKRRDFLKGLGVSLASIWCVAVDRTTRNVEKEPGAADQQTTRNAAVEQTCYSCSDDVGDCPTTRNEDVEQMGYSCSEEWVTEEAHFCADCYYCDNHLDSYEIAGCQEPCGMFDELGGKSIKTIHRINIKSNGVEAVVYDEGIDPFTGCYTYGSYFVPDPLGGVCENCPNRTRSVYGGLSYFGAGCEHACSDWYEGYKSSRT